MSERTYTVEEYDSEQAWLAARRRSLGASEAAAAIGRSRCASPFGLYLRKLEDRDQSPDEDAGAVGAAEMGKLLEPVVGTLFERRGPRPGASLKSFGPWTILRSVERPHLTCTLDGYLPAPLSAGYYNPVASVVELKCAYYDAAKAWKVGVPLGYQIQMQQQMYVAGVTSGYIAALLNGLEFQWHPITRDDDFLRLLLPRLDDFWEKHVVAGVAPEIDGSQSTTHAIRERWGADDGRVIEIEEEEYVQIADRWESARKARMAAETLEAELSNKLKDRLGVASGARLADDSGVFWKSDSRGERRFTRKRGVRWAN